MKRLVIRINTQNAAFTDDPIAECKRMLAASDLSDNARLYDINGNYVGRVTHVNESLPREQINEHTQDALDQTFDGHMRACIVGPQDWVCDDDHGAEPVPLDVFDMNDVKDDQTIRIRRDMFGARLSAPGFLDCTEWSIHDTAQEAAEHLLETYE